MKHQADQHRSECTFQVDDMDFLRLQPYRKSSLKLNGNQKLTPKISSPYTVLQKIGSIAYKLALPPQIRRPSSISALVSFTLSPSQRS